MKRLPQIGFQQRGKFPAVAHTANLFPKILQQHARVIRSSKKCLIDAIGSALHQRAGNPH